MIIFLIYLIFILLSLGQLQRFEYQSLNIALYIHDIAIIFFILTHFYKNRKNIQIFKNIFLSHYTKPIWLCITVALLSLFIGFTKYSTFINMIGLLYLLRLCVYFLFASIIITSSNYLVHLKKSIHIFAAFTIILTFVQYLFFPYMLRPLYFLGWDEHLNRAFGTFLDTSTSSIVLASMFIFYLYFYLKNKSKKYITIAIVFLLLVVLTYSRSILIAIAIVFLFTSLKYIKQMIIPFIALFVCLVMLMIIPRYEGAGVRLFRTFSIESRIKDNTVGFDLFLKHRLFGVGYNRIIAHRNTSSSMRYDHAKSNFSSSFITILATQGIIGAYFFIFMLLRLWQTTSFFGKGYMLLFIIASIFDNILLATFPLIIFFTGYAIFLHEQQ